MWFTYILILLILSLNIDARAIYCDESPSSEYYTGERCTLSGVTSADSTLEIQSHKSQYDYYRETTSNLKKIIFKNSSFEDFPSNTFSRFQYITHLSCVNCGLGDITKYSLNGLSRLTSLNISFGTYKKLLKNLFVQTPNLVVLNVSNGVIEEVDDGTFATLSKLKTLDLSHNKLKRLTKEIFLPLRNLDSVKLSYNEIQVIDEGLFTNNVNLNYLWMDHNNITIIDGQIFDVNTKVTLISLSFNQLTALDIINLRSNHTFVTDNSLTRISIAEATTYLNFTQNNIHTVTCESKESQVTTLILSKNALKGLGCIETLKKLTHLDLSFNEIGKLSPNSFIFLTNLQTLILKSSKITNLVYGVFSHQNQLQYLDISYNYLGDIPLNVLLSATQLKSLIIDGNNITKFSYHDLKSDFKSLETLGIGDNDFNCTFLAEAVTFLNRQKVKTIVASSEKVTHFQNINGIGCKEKSTPKWLKPKSNNGTNSSNHVIEESIDIDLLINQIQLLIESKSVMEDSVQTLDRRVTEIKNGLLEAKSEILKLELADTKNVTNSSNAMIWTLVNQLNNITLEKQLLNNRAQIQEINNLKFEMDKISYKLNEVSDKLLMYIKKESGSGIYYSSNFDSHDVSMIKIIIIVLVILIVIFCFYKGYNFVKKDLPRIRRYNTQNTVHTSLEMDGNRS